MKQRIIRISINQFDYNYPLYILAHHRAKHIGSSEEYVLRQFESNQDLIFDWIFSGNMDFEKDILPYATLVKPNIKLLAERWSNKEYFAILESSTDASDDSKAQSQTICEFQDNCFKEKYKQ